MLRCLYKPATLLAIGGMAVTSLIGLSASASAVPVRPAIVAIPNGPSPGGVLAMCDGYAQANDRHDVAGGEAICYGQYGDNGRPMSDYFSDSQLNPQAKACIRDAGITLLTGMLGGVVAEGARDLIILADATIAGSSAFCIFDFLP
jgi:hypothetical protein